jgi:hypothetical protein
MFTGLFALIASKTYTNVYFIYMMRKSDGLIILTKKIDSSTTFPNLHANFGITSLMINSATDIYLTIKTTTSSEAGFLRLKSFSTSDDIEWYAKIDCGTNS